MKDKRCVKRLIIGGGLSGLTLAYYLKKDYLILEKNSSLGGYCRTIPNNKYVWDYAGHFYHFRTDEFKKLFLSLVEKKEIVHQAKNTKIYLKDSLINYPFQTNIHELEKADFIDCLYDLFFKKEKKVYDNFLDMLYGKFGKSIVEIFLRPYNEKLYATNLKNLDKDAMGRFFPYADLAAIIENMKKSHDTSYNDNFLYLKKGAGYFIDKLASKLSTNNIRLNCTVKKINTKEKFVVTNDNEKIYYEYLINTSPLNDFIYCLDSKHRLLEQLSYNKVLVFNLGFDRPSPRYKNEHWIYFPEKDLNFYRVGFYNNILNTKKLSLYVEIGFSKNQKIDVEKQLRITLQNLKKTGVISKDMKLIDRSVVIMDPAYVHIETKNDKSVQKFIKEIERKDVYTLGRYGKWTYCSMEDCMNWAKELSVKIK